MPAEPLDPPEPRPFYCTYMLLHNVLRILAAESCGVVTTTENTCPTVRAAGDRLRTFGIESDMGEP
jgi:hypothetical protein